MNITGSELKRRYIDFFAGRGHAAISGASLIPENDPTVLFTTAGMHPLVPYILGQPHPSGGRLVNCQPCIRTGDIDLVGDDSHLTFFEMLGNWSLGSYFKEEAIRYSFDFLTRREQLGISREQLEITVFAGDEHAPRDDESAAIWQRQGIAEGRIRYLPRADNWWGPAGSVGPCGPDTEMFVNGVEIWNDVFMQYNKQGDGSYAPLDRRCVDTGMGVERTVCILQGVGSVYETELFRPIIAELEGLCGVRYGSSGGSEGDRSLRIIADHAKASAFIIADAHDIVPSNIGQGYVVRRLVRRAIRHALRIGVAGEFIHRPVQRVIEAYGAEYPALAARRDYIVEVLRGEELLFKKTLARGERIFEREVAAGAGVISGEAAFHLYDTYGFPLELTRELARERGVTVDEAGFAGAFAEHRKKSQAQSAHVFKGGLAEQTEKTTRLHTATHLLHQALREVLGAHVAQKGSNITADRLRFDFSHPQKMLDEELRRVEEIVNAQIGRNLTVCKKIMLLKEAVATGAIALFTDKYQEQVSTYRMGDFSFEVCGGPHVEQTGELGAFKIQKEQSSSQGVRRIKAVLL